MKRFLLLATMLGGVALATTRAEAQISTIDPLLGYCAGGGQCIDNGTNSPTTSLTNFGFVINPGPQTGTLYLDFLVPNNEQVGITTIGVTGTLSGSATLVHPTDWTSGTLGDYLGGIFVNASPSNPLGAYLPATQVYDPTATGFSVYQVNLGTTTLLGSSQPNVEPLLNIDLTLPAGSYVDGFLFVDPNTIATANSGAILCTTACGGTPAPEPMSMALLGTGLLGLGMVRRHRRA